MYLLKPSLHLVSYKSYFYLHSTMYLLKRGQHRRHIQSHMYLHSTMYLLKRKGGVTDVRTDFDLHSTMYLLKLPDEPDELLSSVFTFHYVSIKTRTPAAQQHRHNKFTFHYVSIKTHSPALISFSCLYLHSTMYLLKRNIYCI